MAAEYQPSASSSLSRSASGEDVGRQPQPSSSLDESGEAEAGPSRRRSSQSQAHPHQHAHPHPSRRISRSDARKGPEAEAEAGTDGHGVDDRPTPSSPSTALSPRRTIPAHLDLATYPTQKLLRLLASLLQHIAGANDQLRPDELDLDEEDDGDDGETLERSDSQSGQGGSRSRTHSRASHASSIPPGPGSGPGPSPTTALFSDTSGQGQGQGPGPPNTSSHPHSHSRSNSHSSSHSRTPSSSGAAAPIPTPIWPSEFPLFTASKNSLSHPSSLLAFHARHIPSISIEAYLLRILKYCPTTNEVFLGLLVYFDRMTRLGTPAGVGGESAGVGTGAAGIRGGRGFAIDSYNVHRLVIAGVTVASKFFSDVFYTNSRYAKVGGLPPHELNQLELQFLLLNDFRLRISVEEMQRYGDRLLAYGEEDRSGAELGGGIAEKEDKIKDTSQEGKEDSGKAKQQEQEREQEQQSAEAERKPHRPTHVRQPTDQVVATVTAAADADADEPPTGTATEKMDVDPSPAPDSARTSTPDSEQRAVLPDHPSAPNTEPSSRRASHSHPHPWSSSQPNNPGGTDVSGNTKSQTYPPPSAPPPGSKEYASSAAAALAAIRARDLGANSPAEVSGFDPATKGEEAGEGGRGGTAQAGPPGPISGASGNNNGSGLRDWVGGEVIAAQGRITSPMRD